LDTNLRSIGTREVSFDLVAIWSESASLSGLSSVRVVQASAKTGLGFDLVKASLKEGIKSLHSHRVLD
jgi:hypothetical protein